MQTCPFCKTEINDDATVCPSCHATYGVECTQNSIRLKRACIRSGLKVLVASVVAALVMFVFGYFNPKSDWIIVLELAMMGALLMAVSSLVFLAISLFRREAWWR